MSTNAVPLLSAVLDNAQVPHQGLVLIGDAPAFSGLPLFREILRRATSRYVWHHLAVWTSNAETHHDYSDAPVLLICALHPPSTILPFSFLPSTRVLDLTDSIPGYSSDEAWSDVQERILGACESRDVSFWSRYAVAAEVQADWSQIPLCSRGRRCSSTGSKSWRKITARRRL
jgi:hypothetical protein